MSRSFRRFCAAIALAGWGAAFALAGDGGVASPGGDFPAAAPAAVTPPVPGPPQAPAAAGAGFDAAGEQPADRRCTGARARPLSRESALPPPVVAPPMAPPARLFAAGAHAVLAIVPADLIVPAGARPARWTRRCRPVVARRRFRPLDRFRRPLR